MEHAMNPSEVHLRTIIDGLLEALPKCDECKLAKDCPKVGVDAE